MVFILVSYLVSGSDAWRTATILHFALVNPLADGLCMTSLSFLKLRFIISLFVDSLAYSLLMQSEFAYQISFMVSDV